MTNIVPAPGGFSRGLDFSAVVSPVANLLLNQRLERTKRQASAQLLPLDPKQKAASDQAHIQTVNIPIDTSIARGAYEPENAYKKIYAIKNARSQNFDQLLQNPSLGATISGFKDLPQSEKRQQLVKYFNDLNFDTNFEIGSFEHALASVVKLYGKTSGTAVPSLQTVRETILAFEELIIKWERSGLNMSMPNPGIIAASMMAYENGIELTGSSAEETLSNTKIYFNSHWLGLGLLGAPFSVEQPSYEGKYYNKVLHHWVSNFIEINSIPGPDYSWNSFLKDIKVTMKAPFTELGKEFVKITHGGYISAQKEQEIEKIGKWVDTIIGFVPEVQMVETIIKAATNGLQSFTDALSGVSGRPLTQDEQEEAADNLVNLLSMINRPSEGMIKTGTSEETVSTELIKPGTSEEPLSPKPIAPPDEEEIVIKIGSGIIRGLLTDENGHPTYPLYLKLRPGQKSNGAHGEVDPKTGDFIKDNARNYYPTGTPNEFTHLALKGGSGEMIRPTLDQFIERHKTLPDKIETIIGPFKNVLQKTRDLRQKMSVVMRQLTDLQHDMHTSMDNKEKYRFRLAYLTKEVLEYHSEHVKIEDHTKNILVLDKELTDHRNQYARDSRDFQWNDREVHSLGNKISEKSTELHMTMEATAEQVRSFVKDYNDFKLTRQELSVALAARPSV